VIHARVNSVKPRTNFRSYSHALSCTDTQTLLYEYDAMEMLDTTYFPERETSLADLRDTYRLILVHALLIRLMCCLQRPVKEKARKMQMIQPFRCAGKRSPTLVSHRPPGQAGIGICAGPS
jgi:hypothetical protein